MRRMLGLTMGLGLILFVLLGAMCLLPRMQGVQCVLVDSGNDVAAAIQPGSKTMVLPKMFYEQPSHFVGQPSNDGQYIANASLDQRSHSLVLSVAKADATNIRSLVLPPIVSDGQDYLNGARISWSPDDQYLDFSALGYKHFFVSVRDMKVVESFDPAALIQWMPHGHRISTLDPAQSTKLIVKVPGAQSVDHIIDLVFPKGYSVFNRGYTPELFTQWSDDEQYVGLLYFNVLRYESDIYNLAGEKWLGIQVGMEQDGGGGTYPAFWGWVKDELIYQDNPVHTPFTFNADYQPAKLMAFDEKTRTFKTLVSNVAADFERQSVSVDASSQRLSVLEWQNDDKLRVQLMDYDGSHKFTVFNDANLVDFMWNYSLPYLTVTVLDTPPRPRTEMVFWYTTFATFDQPLNDMRLVWVNFDDTNLHSLIHHRIELLGASAYQLFYLAEDNGTTHLYLADARTGDESIILNDVPQNGWDSGELVWMFRPSPDKHYLAFGYSQGRNYLTSGGPGNAAVYLHGTDGKTQRILKATTDVTLGDWSPDSTFLSLESVVHSIAPTGRSLIVYRAAEPDSTGNDPFYNRPQWRFCPAGSK